MKVFIHGWGFDNSVFEMDKEDIGLSLPGHGNNIPSIEKAVEIYKDTLKPFNNIHIIGWSIGASLGLMLSNYLDTKSLILIGFSPYFKEAHDKTTLLAFKKTMKKNFYEAINEFRKNAYPFPFSAHYPEKDIALNILEEYMELDLRDMVKTTNIPIKLIHGQQDDIVPIQEAHKSIALNKNISLITYKGNHFPDNKNIISSI